MKGNPRAFIQEGRFVCECGREFTKSQSLYAHQSKCKIHLGDRYDPGKHKGWNIGASRAWSKGRTMEDPVYGESLRRVAKATSARLKEHNPLLEWNKNKPSTAYQHQSDTRKLKYHTGELSPAPGVGRGKYSYLIYDDKRILLRSTYEFIYALYLLYNSIQFEYESVRVTYEGRTYISDFLIGHEITEIKGNYHADVSKPREAFESAGYKYSVKFWKDIEVCYEYLKSKVAIDDILEAIKIGHDSKEYYEYKYVT